MTGAGGIVEEKLESMTNKQYNVYVYIPYNVIFFNILYRAVTITM